MAMPGELDHDRCLEESCGKPLELQVCMSGGGYYLGTECDFHGPNSRESGYFATREEAEAALTQWKEGNKVGKRDTEYNVTVNTGTCIVCGKPGTVTLPRAAYERIVAGEHIARAWPEGSVGDREMLINGTHDECFNKLFPPEED